MNDIRVDKNYNLVAENSSFYSDDFDEKIEAIVTAKENNIISEEQMKVLMNFVFRKEIGSKIEAFVKESSVTNKQPQKRELFFMHRNHNTTKNAS